MDRSKPFWRLLPVGIISAAGLAGCASTPGYRPLITSQAPPRPVATAEVGANATAAPVAPAVVAPIAPAPTAPPMDPPARPGTSESFDQTLSEPTHAPPSQAGPALEAPGASVAQPHLSTPMGVLQTPLVPPPAPPASPTENGQRASAPQMPAEGGLAAPGQASLSVNLDAEHAALPNGAVAIKEDPQQPGKKAKPAKPAEPPMSPLARLRKRWHSFTHPAPKTPVPEGDSKPVAATQITVARPVSGYRVPLPTPEVAARVSTPPIHGLYASDDVDAARAVASDKTVPPEIASQHSQENATLQITPSAEAAKPVANNEVEQWPYSAPGATTAQVHPETADASNDFTAISDDEYRTGAARSEHTNGPTIVASPNMPAPAPPAVQEPVPSNDAQPPYASIHPGLTSPTIVAPPTAQPSAVAPTVSAAVPSPAPPASEKSVMVVVPQAVPTSPAVRPQLSRRSATLPSTSRQASHETTVGDGNSIRDLAVGAPLLQRPAVERTGGSDRLDENGNPAGSFNPGWTVPPTEAARPLPSVPGATPRPVAYPQTQNARYGQPAWVNARPNVSAPSAQPLAQPAPITDSTSVAR